MSGEESAKAALPPLPMLYYGSPLNPSWLWWPEDSGRVFLLTRDRGYLGYRLHEIDTATGRRAHRGGRARGTWHRSLPPLGLASTSGHRRWRAGHLVCAKRRLGSPLPVRHPNRRVAPAAHDRPIQRRRDRARRRRWPVALLHGCGPRGDRDPYYPHLYLRQPRRVGTRVAHPGRRRAHRAVCSLRRYFLDTYSRLDLPPVTLVRSAAGRRSASSSGPTSKRCSLPAGGRPSGSRRRPATASPMSMAPSSDPPGSMRTARTPSSTTSTVVRRSTRYRPRSPIRRRSADRPDRVAAVASGTRRRWRSLASWSS